MYSVRNVIFIAGMVIFLAPVFAQVNSSESLEEISAAGARSSVGSSFYSTDTLLVSEAVKSTLKLNKQRLIGLSIAAVFGASAYYFHSKAENTYEQYLVSGNHTEMNRLYDQARRYDRLVGLSFFGTELGMLLIFVSFSDD